MNTNKTNQITIMAQGFYGNRTRTAINREEVDRFILGYLDDSIFMDGESIDRTIVHIPNTDNIVVVYNKYEEEEARQRKTELYETEKYTMKPLAVIAEDGENDIEIYSRCIVCRVNENGEFESLRESDYEKFVKYLAE